MWRILSSLCEKRRSDTVFPGVGEGLRGPPPLPPDILPVPVSDGRTEISPAAPSPSEGDLHAVVDSPSDATSFAQLAEESATACRQAVAKAERRVAGLRQQTCDPREIDMWRRRERAFSHASADAWTPELKTLRTVQEALGEEIEIALPLPGKSFEENADACSKRASKLERASDRCGKLLAEAEAELQRWKLAQTTVAQATSEESLVQVRAELEECGHIPSAAAAEAAADAVRRAEEAKQRSKYGKGVDCYLSPSGYEVVVGRDAASNERVSHEITPPDAFWFHAAGGVAGSHVTIMKSATEVASLADVQFAASIAAWFSKARNDCVAKVTYCYGNQVTRPERNLATGRVLVRGTRGTLMVAPAAPPGWLGGATGT